MVERVRLSEVSAQATAALAALDAAALSRLGMRLEQVADGELEVEPEPLSAIAMSQRVLGDVLAATRRNIDVLQRLQERKVKAEWGR